MTYLDALQATLAGEHAALFVVGYLGAQTSESGSPELYAALARRPTTRTAPARPARRTWCATPGGEPVAAARVVRPARGAPGDPPPVAAAALAVERACGATYGYLVANAVGEQRGWAVEAVLDSALREIALGGRPRAFPGR